MRMLSEGIAPEIERAPICIATRSINACRAAAMLAFRPLTSGGAIPEMADYRVVTEGDRTFVGTLNEDFAIESQTGNVFQLGNASWRILYVRGGEVTVRDAHGRRRRCHFGWAKPLARTAELSREFSEFAKRFGSERKESEPAACSWLQGETGASNWAAEQAGDVCGCARRCNWHDSDVSDASSSSDFSMNPAACN